jgi:DNA-binding transcriptional MocR family regulator
MPSRSAISISLRRRAYPANTSAPRNHVRLSYSYATVDQIEEGVKRLATVYELVEA